MALPTPDVAKAKAKNDQGISVLQIPTLVATMRGAIKTAPHHDGTPPAKIRTASHLVNAALKTQGRSLGPVEYNPSQATPTAYADGTITVSAEALKRPAFELAELILRETVKNSRAAA